MSVESQKQKQIVIDEISEKLSKAASAVVIDYMGITVAQADRMRKMLREADIDYKVYKNSLVSRAISGTDFAPLEEVLAGPSAFAFSYDDATAPARILNGVIKEYKKMEFKAGIVEGVFYNADGIQEIANVPSREELLAKFLGSIQSPVSKFVRTLAAIAEAKEDGTTVSAEEKTAETEAAPVAEEASAEAPAEAEAAPVAEEAAAEEKPAEAEAAPTAEEAAPAETEKPAEEAAPVTEETPAVEASAEAEATPAAEEAAPEETPDKTEES